MDNSVMKPSEIFYGKTQETAESDTHNAPDEVITETEAAETAPIEDETEIVESDIEESESEESDQVDPDVSEEESLYVDFNGKETSFDEIAQWEQAFIDRKSMQADYTRKTQEVSTIANAKAQEMVGKEVESLKTLAAELEAAIGSEDEVNMEELREYDPGEYLKKKEQQEKREKLLSKAKESFNTTAQVSDADVATEREALVKANPQWVDDKGAATDVYKTDMASLDKYLGDNDWTQEEFSTVYQSKHITALIKAAKFDALQGKQKAISKKVRKAPVVKKGKSTAKAKDKPVESITDIFYPKK